MTNREWLEKLSDEELAHFIVLGDDYCHPEDDDMFCTGDVCQHCVLKWLTQEHPNPMPELKAGMFVKVKHTFGDYGIGVVTQDIVVYENGGFDWISQITNDVIAIYQTNCFDGCNDNNIVWKKS